MTPTVETAILSPLWEKLDFDPSAEALRVISHALKTATGNGEVEVSVALTDDKSIQKLNKEFRNKDKPTNVLSFPATGEKDFHAPGEPKMLGDIIISYETMMAEAKAMDVTPTEHFTHLLVHGTLHLLGFDHEEEKEAEEMEALEIKILGEIGIKNPYLNAKFVA